MSLAVPEPTLPFARRSRAEHLLYPPRTLWNWFASNLHNLYGSARVVDFVVRCRMPPGLLPADHPWVTGVSPWTGRPVWPDNLVYASPNRRRRSGAGGSDEATDAEIVSSVGRFMATMVARSVPDDPPVPRGPRRRMPHAVNYIHGPIQASGGFVVLDDLEDGRFHFSCREFIAEIRRFAREERRELTVVFRDRHLDPIELSHFVALVRARLPWYANGNAPSQKRILWGTPSPYIAVNPINGVWIREMDRLQARRWDELVRPPIPAGRYFQGSYRGDQPGYTRMERFHAWAIAKVIDWKGFQGGLAFTRRAAIEPGNWRRYVASGGRWRAGHEVPWPFGRPRGETAGDDGGERPVPAACPAGLRGPGPGPRLGDLPPRPVHLLASLAGGFVAALLVRRIARRGRARARSLLSSRATTDPTRNPRPARARVRPDGSRLRDDLLENAKT